MTTIITQTNSEGTRRCDAKCHEAAHEKCRCICGGRYHGAAKDGSMEAKLREDQESLIERMREDVARLKELEGAIAKARQKELFEEVKNT